ncbi:MAG TPA: hypothetical protein VHE99_03775 [Gammaproteobacteria bacterium]|nr:hypothetical protein [Gammaproteobacteria bacterium]
MSHLSKETSPPPEQKAHGKDNFWEQYLEAWKTVENDSAKLLKDFKEFSASGADLRSSWEQLSEFRHSWRMGLM